MRKLVCEMLDAQGYTVLEAFNGAEALSLVQRHAGRRIHLLVADLVMPLVDGKELAERVRAAYPEIKVLFISGFGEDSLENGSLLDARVDFLAKPFLPDTLVSKVRELLG